MEKPRLRAGNMSDRPSTHELAAEIWYAADRHCNRRLRDTRPMAADLAMPYSNIGGFVRGTRFSICAGCGRLGGPFAFCSAPQVSPLCLTGN